MISNEVDFFIKRCSGKSYCESEANIDKYINEVTVDFWTL